MEDVDTDIKEPIKSISTNALIAELKIRELTSDHIFALQTLKPTKDLAGHPVSDGNIETVATVETGFAVEKFVNAVEKKKSFGKLPLGSTTDGRSIDGLGGGFYDHGPDKFDLPEAESGVANIQSIIYNKQDYYSEQMSFQIVSVAPSEVNRSSMVLTIRFFQDRKQIDGRGWCTPAHVSVEIPTTTMLEFVREIQKKPDLLEDFYQKAFAGLDNVGDKPGMRRLSAKGFYFVQGDNLGEAAKVEQYSGISVNNFFTSLQKYEYQNGPYGSGDVFKPR